VADGRSRQENPFPDLARQVAGVAGMGEAQPRKMIEKGWWSSFPVC
jgi:hypothetical protein